MKRAKKKVLLLEKADNLYCLIYTRKRGFRYQYFCGTDYNEMMCEGEAVTIFPERKMKKILRCIAEREEARIKTDGYTAQYTFIDEISREGE